LDRRRMAMEVAAPAVVAEVVADLPVQAAAVERAVLPEREDRWVRPAPVFAEDIGDMDTAIGQ